MEQKKTSFLYGRICRLIFFLLAWSLPAGHAYGQNRLEEIEKNIRKAGMAITNMIGDSAITNESGLYKKISNRRFTDFDWKINHSNDTIGAVQDYYKYRFKDSILFNNTCFWQDLDLSLARCVSYVSFHLSELHGKALFSWTQFHTSVVFSRSKFRKDAIFQHAVFDGSTDFFQSHFYAAADFYGSRFGENTNFGNIRSFKEANFSFTQIDADCSFKNAELIQCCLFNNSQINACLDFSGARFDSLANFSCCTVKGSIVFNNTTLPAFLDLSGISSINGIIDLTQIKMNEKSRPCFINLVDSDVSKIRLHYEDFQLWFPANTSYETKCKAYEGLLRSLHSFGFISGYEKLDIEYLQLKYAYHGQYIKNEFQRAWWNYGYDKERIFSWLFWIVLLLTIINSLFIRSLMGSIYEMKYLNYSKVSERYKLHHPLLAFFLNIPTGFLYTVILLVGGAFGIKFSSDQLRFPNFIGMLYIISVGLLGISCSAFVLKFIFDL